MFSIKNKISIILLISCFGIVGLQGCDQISSLVDELVSKKQAKNTPSAALKEKVMAKTSAADLNAGEKSAQEAEQSIPQNVLAKVGDWTLTIEEFKERLTALKEIAPEYDINDIEQNKQILEELLRQQLLVQDAEQSGLAKKKEVAQAVEEFRRSLLVREVAVKVAGDITATDEEAQQYYDENPQDFTDPVEWKIRELVVDTEEEAKSILVELYQGSDFAAMVARKSKAKSSAQGGDLGYISAFDSPKMENIVSSLEVGGISGVFKGPEGFYIVKLEDKKGGKVHEFEEFKEEIKRGLVFLKQQQAILEHLNVLQQKTTIYINDKLLEETK